MRRTTRRWRLWGAAAAVATLLAGPAQARSLLLEATASRSLWALSLLADLPLVKDQLHLTLCYGVARGGGGPAVHQLCAGMDLAIGDRLLVSATLSLSPRTTLRQPIFDGFVFSAHRSSLGGTLALAYTRPAGRGLEWVADATVGLTRHDVPHSWTFVTATGQTRTRTVPASLLVARPGVGVLLVVEHDLELSLRGSLHLYSADPLEVGRISDAEIAALSERLEHLRDTHRERSELSRALAELSAGTLGGRIMQADAISGLAIAPLRFELRPSVSYRFSDALRGQVSYGFEQYAGGAGVSHVLSTRWTARLSEQLRAWTAVAVQVDRPEDPQLRGTAALLTVGVELGF